MRLLALIMVATPGCIATLSEPHSDAHLAAMREATRHHHHGRFDQAAAAWQEASRTADRRVDRDEADYRRARTLRRLSRDDEAIALLDAIAARRPISRRTVRARFDAALMRLDRGESGAAHASLEWIVREHPEQGPAGRALRILLEARTEAEQLAFVRELYEAVGQTDLGDDLLTREAELLTEADDLDGAVAALERICSEHPYPHGQRWDDSLWRLADIAQGRGQHEAAIAYLRRMIEPHTQTVSPGSQTLVLFPRAGLRIARIYRDELDSPDEAETAFRAMVSEFPTSLLRDDALYELGAMWLDRGQPDRGCPVLREVLDGFEVGHARRLAAARVAADCGSR